MKRRPWKWGGEDEDSALLYQPLDPRCTVRGGLTQNEIGISRDLFGDKVDTGRVRILFCDAAMGREACEKNNLKGNCSGAARAAKDANTAHDLLFFDTPMHQQDYGTAASESFTTFVHEAAHLYQKQMPVKPVVLKKYDYTLTPETKFGDLCDEQQARAIEDYGAYFHRPGVRSSGIPEKYVLLQKMIEDELPEAKKTRLALEAGRGWHGCSTPRALTAGEKSLARRFGPAVDVEGATVHFCPETMRYGAADTAYAVGAKHNSFIFHTTPEADFSADEKKLYSGFFPALATAYSCNTGSAGPGEKEGCAWYERDRLTDYAARFLDPRKQVDVRSSPLNSNGSAATRLREYGDALPGLKALRISLLEKRSNGG